MSLRLISFIAFYLMMSGLVMPAAFAADLDGMVFDGVLREADSNTGGDDDLLEFKRGQFTSRACEAYGFSSAGYSVERVGEGLSFSATVVSPSHGKMEWTGIVRGGQLQADVVWTKERWYWDTRREYRFEGSLMPQSGADD